LKLLLNLVNYGWININSPIFIGVFMELKEIFKMQSDLNDYVFSKKNIKDLDGNALTTDKLIASGKSEEEILCVSITNDWLKKYSWALGDELRELNDELMDKWWSKDPLDMQNIRVELIDILHFLVSAMMTAGMEAEDVERIYTQKWKKNFARQDNGYSKSTKTEDDNKEIK
jgi:dimeric dUTPase (all-alpha-NTP-PPase superfamily)